MEPDFDHPMFNQMIATTWWSFGRDRILRANAVQRLESGGARVHDAWSDVDLNRTMIAFSGVQTEVAHALLEAAEAVLPSIHLEKHSGTHPRTGALDLVRLSPLDESGSGREALEIIGHHLGSVLALPVFADGPESDGASERRLLELRRGGFGKLLGRVLDPDFGPPLAHPQWGATGVMVGPLHLHAVQELVDPTARVAHRVAETLNQYRSEGDPHLIGVHAEGFVQPTREGSMIMLTFELADDFNADRVLNVIERETRKRGAGMGRARALGAWRMSDTPKATRLAMTDRQIWDDVFI